MNNKDGVIYILFTINALGIMIFNYFIRDYFQVGFWFVMMYGIIIIAVIDYMLSEN